MKQIWACEIIPNYVKGRVCDCFMGTDHFKSGTKLKII